MSSLSFQVQPQEFKRVLTNVIEFGKDKPGDATGSLYVMLHVDGGDDGTFSALSLARRSAGRDWVDIEAPGGDTEAADVLVPMAGKVRGEALDTLEKLASSCGVSTAKDARLFVTIHHRQKITVEYGGKLVGELADVGDHPDIEQRLAKVEDTLDFAPSQTFTGPTAFVTHTLGKLAKVRVGRFAADDSTVADIGQLVDMPDVAVVKIGDTFDGLLATVDRALYASGGPHHTGPGRPGHLLNEQPGGTK